MKRFLPSSLRGRLLVLLLVAMLPSLALLAHAAWRARAGAEREAEARALAVVRQGAAAHARLVEAARARAAALARAPELRAADPAAAAELLDRTVHGEDAFLDAGFADAAGRVLARHVPGGAGEVGEAAWFDRALGSDAPVLSRLESPAEGGPPTLVAAARVAAANGDPAGVAWVRFRLDWLAAAAAGVERMPGGVAMVMDARGMLLAAIPDARGWTGRDARSARLVETVRARREGVAHLAGLDGVRRVHAFAPLGDAGGRETYLIAGFLEDETLAAAQRTFVRSLVLLALFGVALTLVAWHGAAIVVLRPVGRMLAAARAVAVGDLRVRAGPPYSRSELGELARAFDDMSDALRRRRLERDVAETALRDLSARRAAVVEGSPDGIVTLDADGRILEINSSAERMFGWPRSRALGRDFLEVMVPPELREASRRTFRAVVAGGDAPWLGRPAETRARRVDGAEFPVEFAMTRIELERGGPLFSLYVRDITHRRQVEQALRSLSLVDDLTGLYNRRGFLAFGQQQLRVADRTGRELTVVFADLNGLKEINDRFGHAEGDRAIVEAAGALRATFRRSDVIGRLGGDEFAALALETSPSTVARLELRLAERIAALNRVAERPWTLAMSIGRARYDPQHPCSMEELIARADEAMYRRKRDRRAALSHRGA
uniref:Diguanylate cyclase n=1 Tax=Eiseniibacteriota bacterium TaxID=2212470 RepID=A0A832ML96_UNCEI